MTKLNRSVKSDQIHTHEGAVAKRINPEMQLRRLVMSCMLWEDNFYVDGKTVAEQIAETLYKTVPERAKEIVISARNEMNLRHVPLLLAREMARLDSHKHYVREILSNVIQRPDELAEYLSIYWKDGRQPLSAQSKKGLADAFKKFNEYSLAKYNRNSEIKLRDVLFMTHPKPKDVEQEELWKRLVNDELKTPDTWEVSLSSDDGLSKRVKWERLLSENKLGALALLRNLRNMIQEGVNDELIIQALENMKTEKVLPFRFISAYNHAPKFVPYLEKAMFKSLENHERFQGSTVLLVDVSGSMNQRLSSRSDMNRMEAACALAMLIREISDDVKIFTFSGNLIEVKPLRGFALRDAILKSQPHSGTWLGSSIKALYEPKEKVVEDTCFGFHRNRFKGQGQNPDRLIVFTDEQSHDRVPDPKGLAYMINVASYKNGVGYGKWKHIDGFSEKIVDFIQVLEKELI